MPPQKFQDINTVVKQLSNIVKSTIDDNNRRELQLPKQIDTLSIVVYKYLREWGEIAKDYDLNNYELDPSLEDVPHTLENGKASVKRWAEEIQKLDRSEDGCFGCKSKKENLQQRVKDSPYLKNFDNNFEEIEAATERMRRLRAACKKAVENLQSVAKHRESVAGAKKGEEAKKGGEGQDDLKKPGSKKKKTKDATPISAESRCCGLGWCSWLQ
eukprot:TRINITY_DN11524_c0_g1_i4.p1 TRINITY_DN11524_c0_g1~~TRINITY_DN11524_c0_g1_i4.p1  ORF type:complete len:214 (+),score=56.92 TRINITY_DN11524_c0_g1_i4:44-685(+)